MFKAHQAIFAKKVWGVPRMSLCFFVCVVTMEPKQTITIELLSMVSAE